jgi:hypothetical protein
MAMFSITTSLTSPLAVGPYLLQPKKVYNDALIPLNDPQVASAFARGLIVFTDSTNTVTHLQNPVIAAAVKIGHALVGWLGSNNVFVA